MLPYNAHKNNQGFTIVETLAIFVIVGILSAIAAPSFLGLFTKTKVNDPVDQIRGALQEAQREAVRKSNPCNVILDTADHKITGSCLVTGERTLPDGVEMKTNVVPETGETKPKIRFGIRGDTTFTIGISGTPIDKSSGKIVLFQADGSTSDRKCVAISNGIGIIRSGTYSGDIDTAENITNGTCKASY